MPALLLYLIKVTACSGLLMAYYWFALRDKQFHQYNRFYLLFALAGSVVLPLIQMEWFVQSRNETAVKLMQVIYTYKAHTPSPVTINWWHILTIAIATISTLMLLLQVTSIIKLRRLKQRYPNNQYSQEFLFIETDLPQAPFTFFNWLFWRNDLDAGTETGQQILMHELTHIQQKHTWDKLLLRIVLCFYWMNPFFWLLQRELYMVHEFIADNKAIANKDASAFAAMLLNSRLGKFPYTIAHPFFYSPIKRRLTMFTTSKLPRYSYARRLMVLPVTGVIVLLFAFRIKEEQLQPFNKVVQTQTDSASVQQDTTRKNKTVKLKKVEVTASSIKGTGHVTAINITPTKDSSKNNEITIIADTIVIVKSSAGVDENNKLQIKTRNLKIKNIQSNQQPLYYINDVLVTREELEALPPDDIQSVNVLKDLTAIQRYGEKAANGVVLIYTKKSSNP